MKRILIFIAVLSVGMFCCKIVLAEEAKFKEHSPKMGKMNPYEEYGLEKTQKIEFQVQKIIKRQPTWQGRFLIDNTQYSEILAELNKEMEYVNDQTMSTGDGKLFIILDDGTEIEFRVKHGGVILEYKYGDFKNVKNFEMTETFSQIIRKYYSEEQKEYYEIDDKYQKGELSEDEWGEMLEEHKKRYPIDDEN